MELQEFNQILSDNPLTIIKLGAEWCSPCRTMEPIIESVAEQFKDTVRFETIDVDESPDISTQYKVRSIPTMLFFKNSELKDKSVGAMSEEELIKRVNNLIEQ